MYTPKLQDDLVRKLYQLKLRTKKPMTFLLNEAVRSFLEASECSATPETNTQLSFLHINNSKTKTSR